MYRFRKMEERDLDTVEKMLNAARKHMGEVLKLTQWQGEYPSRRDFAEDIALSRAYVLCDDDDLPIAAAMVRTGKEPAYDKMTDGNGEFSGIWQYEKETSGSVHRFCVSQELNGRGIGSAFMREIFAHFKSIGVRSVRIDTHRANKPMRRMLEKCGFRAVGIVLVPEPFDPERIAYEYAIV